MSYAYDSLYGAYLKSHYPLEYYTVALNYYNGDSVRTLKLISELPEFGLQLKPIKFRHSKSNYAPSKEDSSIYKGVESIKDMNGKVADEIYELRNNRYDTFTDLLFDITTKTSAKKNQIKILIELDYFEEFGEANTLLAKFDFFTKFSKRSQFKKDELSTLGISEDTIRKYSGKETEKMFTDVDFCSFVRDADKEIKAPPRRLSEMVKRQTELLGYVTIMDEKYRRMAAVSEVDTKYSPRLKMYSLKNGTTLDCKIDKRTFNKTKLSVGDIVRITGTKEKPKVKKDENGEWVSIPDTKELWITSYEILTNL